MKAHTIIKNDIAEEYVIFHNGNEFKIRRFLNVKGFTDNKSFFVYKKIGYQTYTSLSGKSVFDTMQEAKKGIKNRND